MTTEERRDLFLEHLRGRGIGAAFHYVPLHLSPMGRSLGYRRGQFPEAESIASRLVRLPIYPSLAHDEVDGIIKAVEEFK
jgi:dTDP-4-amino-4,6-dideoxygalactose transaminase